MRKGFEIGDRVKFQPANRSGAVVAVVSTGVATVIRIKPDDMGREFNAWPEELLPIREADQTGGWRLEE